MSKLHFIQTGGTIDKDYLTDDTNRAYNFVIGEAAFHPILRRAETSAPHSFATACQKDSSDMDDQDRDTIRQMVLRAEADRVIITHGTDTLHLTARHLSDIPHKVIILTGALKPERLRDSDADFNLGMAVGAIPHLPAGVYIALGGQVRHWSAHRPK